MRLHAVTLLVPDYDEGIAFYVGRLGFDLLADEAEAEDEEGGGGRRWVLVRPPGGGAALLLARAEGAQADAVGRQAGGRVAFFLMSGDFDADHARMVAAGVAFEEEPRREAYGPVAVWRDPWGNRWDLLGPPPAA